MTRVLTALVLAAAIAAPAAAQTKPSLMNPASLTEQAPATYRVKFDTSAGEFIVTVTRAWAQIGADRFYNLVKAGYYDGTRFFRVVPNFMVQFGINGDPDVQRNWLNANIKDDPSGVKSNARGTITFANRGPNTRTTQVFINFRNNANLDRQFMPFGEVTTGMAVVDKINAKHGENPDQSQIQANGNRYLQKAFPDLDFIKKATIEPAATPAKK
jgi:peptidyl-prolyl cis-trans isomerase A (cyclophilin A)